MIGAPSNGAIRNHKSAISNPMTALKSFASSHPRITAWIVLGIGMVLILLWASKDVGLLPTQLLALVVATIALAGLCVWIIGWEDNGDEDAPPQTPSPGK
jgi:hypothetical protein